MPIKKEIIVTTTFISLHYWPEASNPVAFLAYPHRHRFYVKMHLAVERTNREKEFFIVKKELDNYINTKLLMDIGGTIPSVGSQSCEDLALKIQGEFDAEQVEVWEDQENGACVFKTEE